jgi:hypothetical protein
VLRTSSADAIGVVLFWSHRGPQFKLTLLDMNTSSQKHVMEDNNDSLYDRSDYVEEGVIHNGYREYEGDAGVMHEMDQEYDEQRPGSHAGTGVKQSEAQSPIPSFNIMDESEVLICRSGNVQQKDCALVISKFEDFAMMQAQGLGATNG